MRLSHRSIRLLRHLSHLRHRHTGVVLSNTGEGFFSPLAQFIQHLVDRSYLQVQLAKIKRESALQLVLINIIRHTLCLPPLSYLFFFAYIERSIGAFCSAITSFTFIIAPRCSIICSFAPLACASVSVRSSPVKRNPKLSLIL